MDAITLVKPDNSVLIDAASVITPLDRPPHLQVGVWSDYPPAFDKYPIAKTVEPVWAQRKPAVGYSIPGNTDVGLTLVVRLVDPSRSGTFTAIHVTYHSSGRNYARILEDGLTLNAHSAGCNLGASSAQPASTL